MMPGLRDQNSNTTMTWRTGRAVPSLHNQTQKRCYFCELHSCKAHQAPRNHSNIQSSCSATSHGPCSLISNSVKQDSSGGSKTPSSKATKKLTTHWALLQAARMLFHTHRISLNWRRHQDCTQSGHRHTVAWRAHLSTSTGHTTHGDLCPRVTIAVLGICQQ